ESASGTVYLGGGFTVVGGEDRLHAAAVDAVTGIPTSWSPTPGNEVYALAVSSDLSWMYLGGTFLTMNGVARSNIAALDLTTGQATSWDPYADGGVNDLAVSPDGTIVYAGGDFSFIGGEPRNRIAALDASTGVATTWDPSADNTVSALAIHPDGTKVYAGGTFSSIGGDAYPYLAELDASTGLVTTWYPAPSRKVNSLAINETGSRLYSGEWNTRCDLFPGPVVLTSITLAALPGCTYSGYVNAFDTVNQTTLWGVSSNHHVQNVALSPDGSTLYVGGNYTYIDGSSRKRLAAFDASTGSLSPMAPDIDGIVYAVRPDVTGSTLYIGGSFSSIAGTAREGLAAISTATDALRTWNPGLNGNPYEIVTDPTGKHLLIGGGFYTVGQAIRPYLADFRGPAVAFTQSSSQQSTSAAASIGVTLSAAGASDVKVGVIATGGTAVAGTDYVLSSAPLTIPAGSLTGNLSFSVFPSAAGKTLTLTMTDLKNASPGAVTVHAVTFTGGAGSNVVGGNGSEGGASTMVPGWNNPPNGPFGIVANDGAATTLSRIVFLRLSAGANAVKMALSNFADMRNAVIERFMPDKIWLLCGGDETCDPGTKSIFAQFYTDNGVVSERVSDDITYAPAPKGEVLAAEDVADGSDTGLKLRFTRDLRTGDTGEDVRQLQRFLNSNGFTVAKDGPGSPGNETAMFGALTRAAVRSFQDAFRADILTPIGLSRGTGTFGPATRAFVNGLDLTVGARPAAPCSAPNPWCY
ncbi:peptidoglycan-binding protein, partial [Candidatus Uhrbacteria bacterium]|nr:peptidoglycan-binding protein [Candidatus Uhrbacteria bacterium]